MNYFLGINFSRSSTHAKAYVKVQFSFTNKIKEQHFENSWLFNILNFYKLKYETV
jgi:hypothetical protein